MEIPQNCINSSSSYICQLNTLPQFIIKSYEIVFNQSLQINNVCLQQVQKNRIKLKVTIFQIKQINTLILNFTYYKIAVTKIMRQKKEEENQQVEIKFKKPTLARRKIKKMFLEKKDIQLYILDDKFKSIKKQKRLDEIYQFFQEIQQWGIIKIKVQGQFEAQIQCSYFLTSIKEIGFPKLTTLNLWKCQLESLEPLLYLKAPDIRFLYFDENRISSLRSFRKCHFPNLTQISIRRNRITECRELIQMEVAFCREIVFQFWNPDNPMDESALNWFVKMHTPSMRKIQFSSGDRIRMQKIIPVIIQKFPHMEIFLKSANHDF